MKKVLNLLSIVVGIALIIVCADLVSNKLSKTKLTELDEIDRNAIEELCQMNALFDEKYGSDEIWNENYNMRDYSAVITRKEDVGKGRTYVINMTLNRNVFAQKIDLPSEYDGIPVYRLSYLAPETFKLAKIEQPCFETVFGSRVYVTTYDTQSVMFNGTDSLEEAYVKSTFTDAVESIDIPTGTSAHFEKEAENIALLGLEYCLIDDIMSAKSKEQLDELVEEYVIVRDYQDEKYPDFAETRKNIETKYGCAQYVFYDISRMIDHNITFFNKEESESITFYSAYYYLCTGRYNSDVSEFLDDTGVVYSGAALCRIINDNSLKNEWESCVCENTSPYDILKKYSARHKDGSVNKTIDDVKRAYDYEEIIGLARTLEKELKK